MVAALIILAFGLLIIAGGDCLAEKAARAVEGRQRGEARNHTHKENR